MLTTKHLQVILLAGEPMGKALQEDDKQKNLHLFPSRSLTVTGLKGYTSQDSYWAGLTHFSFYLLSCSFFPPPSDFTESTKRKKFKLHS